MLIKWLPCIIQVCLQDTKELLKHIWPCQINFFIPDLMHYLRSCIKGCHIFQLSNKDKIPNRHFQRQINLNYRPLSRLSMDLKVMSKSYRGHTFILCVIDERTNYLMAMPIYQARSEEMGNSLIDNVISQIWHTRILDYGPR